MSRFLNWARKLSATRPTAVRRQPVARLALESLEERTVPSLTPVSPSAGYPFTSICKVNIWFPDGGEYVGSGAVVDSFHVMTAGHVVYDAGHGGWAKWIEVVPEMSGSSQPFGDAWMTHELTYTTWLSASQNHPGKTGPGDMDIGLITLDRNIGYRTGWMAFGYDGSSSYNLNTAGYPAAAPYSGQTMYFDYGTGTVSGSNIYFSDGAVGGQSGSPLWSYYPSSGSRIIRGVLVGSNGISTRITSQVFNDFENAMNSDIRPATASPSAAQLLGHAGAPSHSPGQAAAASILAGLSGGGRGTDAVAKDAVFAATHPTGPAATGPGATTDAAAGARAVPPASGVQLRHTVGSASAVADAPLSDPLALDRAPL
jgi:V8-like Glu-specific endopeptidase